MASLRRFLHRLRTFLLPHRAERELSHEITSLIFGVTPLDPWTYAIVAGVLLLAATLASYIPAHRVTMIDPVEALRIE